MDNLYVVDGSFFPSSGAVNPALTIMANALRVGDHLLERLKHDVKPFCGDGSRDLSVLLAWRASTPRSWLLRSAFAWRSRQRRPPSPPKSGLVTAVACRSG